MRLDDEVEHWYRLARTAFVCGDLEEAERLYRKLRAEHGVELYYEVDLPRPLMFVHPVGTVLGRATYGRYLCVYQGVGVGSTLDGARPVIGDGVVLFPGCKVLGDTVIGNNCFITANTVLQNCRVPDNSIVVGREISTTTRNVKRDVFGVTE